MGETWMLAWRHRQYAPAQLRGAMQALSQEWLSC
jgi:hypothetical protein